MLTFELFEPETFKSALSTKGKHRLLIFLKKMVQAKVSSMFFQGVLNI